MRLLKGEGFAVLRGPSPALLLGNLQFFVWPREV